MSDSKLQFLLDDNEQILWEDRPDILSFLLKCCPVCLGIMIFCFPAFISGVAMLWASSQMETPALGYVFIFYMVFHPFLFMFLSCCIRAIKWRYVRYAITSKRIYMESGIIGRDIRTVEFSQIQSPLVNVGLIEKLRSKGTINLTTELFTGRHGRTGTRVSSALMSISDPYEVFKMIKKMSLDIRTDEQFPNAMRPDNNPGYNTSYDGPYT